MGIGIKGMIEKVIGTYSDRELKKIYPIADKVTALEDEMAQKSEAELKGMTGKLKERLAAGETLDDILPEAFAVCREAAWRVLGMKHFPVQIVGGIVLHQGRIAEMKTGEGKTLVATLPAYLNALSGKGVHIVTVNDYLAKRDSEWMGKLYNYLGLSVGLIIHDMDNAQGKRRTTRILPTEPITRWALTTCVTTWLYIRKIRFREVTTTPLWTRWTVFS